ncbi:MAG: phosphate acyltransferase PlsX [Oscillospiraceae bacterium]|nr:phosphate acyltransferase PlsX [Oscillospiraceae bacterium]
MKIIVDAFGGDNAPLEILKGCRSAADDFKVEIILVGDEEKIYSCANQNGIKLDGMEILDAPEVMLMTDSPSEVLKSKKNSSMAVGLQALADGKGDAFVSAGSTGALVMGATFLVKRIKGVKRPAIGSVLPSNDKPFLLLDCGANADCTAEHLKQFAQMGSIYMEKFVKCKSPRVALANIGTEDSKGDRLRHEAFSLLKDCSDINFIGNVETRDVPYGCCDVLVADGFTGNIILKLYEGVAGAMMDNIKSIFKKSSITMLAAMMVKGGLLGLKMRMDYSEFGGAPLLGVNGVVIKAHGSSDAKALRNAIRQAKTCAEMDVVGTIARSVEKDSDTESED